MAYYIVAPAFSPSFAPAPSPAHHRKHPFPIKPCSCSCPYRRHDAVFSHELVHDLRVLAIISSVLVTVILLYLLFFLGRIRRSVRWNYYIAYITKISYVFLPIAITYIMGVLHKDPEPHKLFPVLAATLVYAYGGVVTISACDLSDNDESLGYVLRTLPLFFWTAWLMFLVFDLINYKSMAALVCTLFCFLALAVVNARQTLEAFYKASRSKGLSREVEPLAQYMEAQSKREDLGVNRPNPRTMRGFNYMVWGRENNVTTIDEVWKWVTTKDEECDEGGMEPTLLARKRRFLARCGGKDQLRDLCLSYALFRMLLVRFAGFPPPIYDHTNPIHPRRLIQEGILHSKEPQRVFRIIEVELDFLFDHFYTKSHVCASYRFRDIWQNLVQILFIGCVAAFAVPMIMKDHLSYHFKKVVRWEVIATCSILLMVVFLESVKYLMVHFSNRKLVWLLCTGIKETASSDKWARTTQQRIVWIWTIKSWLSSKFDVSFLCFFWPWQRKLAQYSFLDNYGKVPILARKPFSPLSKLVKLPRTGQRGDYVVPLSKQVKQAIISSLVSNRELNLSRGRDTIRRYQLPSGSQSESNDVSFILVWHIATSFCESLHPIQNPNDPDHEHFLVANQLSKYCAYLVAFTPQLLPNHHVYTMERVFDKAVREANDLDMKRLNENEVYQRLVTSAQGVNGDNIVVRGASLARQLSGEFMIENVSQGWRVLAEFWAELLLYLAPSENMAVHVEYLARGGEFITHLWVLLTHAGVLTTNSSTSPI